MTQEETMEIGQNLKREIQDQEERKDKRVKLADKENEIISVPVAGVAVKEEFSGAAVKEEIFSVAVQVSAHDAVPVYKKEEPEAKLEAGLQVASADGDENQVDKETEVFGGDETQANTEVIANDPEVSFKIKITGLGRNCNKKEAVKLLKKHNLEFKNVKSAPKWDYALVSFIDEKSMKLAQVGLNGIEYKKDKLKCHAFSQNTRKTVFKPKVIEDDGRSHDERLADQVTPLWRLDYLSQLEQKQAELKKMMQKFKSDIFKFLPKSSYNMMRPDTKESEDMLKVIKDLNSDQRALIQLQWIHDAYKDNDGSPCPMDAILASPQTDGYRSKYEFTLGRDPNGERTCGFLLGLFREGFHAIVKPENCLHVSKNAKLIADVLEEYISDSKYPTYDRIEKKGFFRAALVRTLSSGENMIMLQVNGTGVPRNELDEERQIFKKHIIENLKLKEVSVNSLYWQESSDAFNGFKDDCPSILIHGNSFVTEQILGQTFQISVSSFFQVNPKATEVLYSKIREIAMEAAIQENGIEGKQSEEINVEISGNAIGSDTKEQSEDKSLNNVKNCDAVVGQNNGTFKNSKVVLLDLCCGTGTIGISMAKSVKKVIGVEMCAAAIEDAKLNAKLNGIDNVVYLNAKVEDAIGSVLNDHISPDDIVIAVLDPPRIGVQPKVIQAIRGCDRINHVIFVACNFKSSMQNSVDLCRPSSNRYPGFPFVPVRTYAVDLFPHTEHFEVILQFKRQDGKSYV